MLDRMQILEQLIIGSAVGVGLVLVVMFLATLTRWLVSGWRRPGGVGRRGRRRGR
jgi:hypothetical protein